MSRKTTTWKRNDDEKTTKIEIKRDARIKKEKRNINATNYEVKFPHNEDISLEIPYHIEKEEATNISGGI